MGTFIAFFLLFAWILGCISNEGIARVTLGEPTDQLRRRRPREPLAWTPPIEGLDIEN